MKKLSIIITVVVVLIAGIIFINRREVREKKFLIAFVIDDWGYNRKNIDLVCQIDRPLTISILPNLWYSKEIAETIMKKSLLHDIILHLPLEAKSNRARELNTILCDMEDEEILSILEGDIESVHGIIGVSNHQGSKATEDERVISVIFRMLKKKGLFFLDSWTTSKSVCLDVARDIGLKCIRRDVFLDITDQTDLEHFEDYIRKQIKELADTAKKKGRAIGIGHNKKIMLEVLKDSIPELEKQGIEIVSLKELVR